MAVRDRVLELRRVPASELRANPNNWRRHPAYQAKALRSILEQVGYADALLARETADGLELIDGHLRAETTPDEIVPVLVLDLDEAEAGLVLATLDPLAGMAETDQDALFRLLEAVEIPDDDLARVLEGLTGQADPVGLTDPDDVPSPPAKPKTKLGDLWLLGEHRLLCGDATKRDSYGVLMDGAAADILVTDPPYGVSFGKGSTAKAIRGDVGQAAIPVGFACAIEALTPDGRLYVFGASEQFAMYLSIWDHHLRAVPRVIVWVKETFVLRQIAYHSRFEFIYWGWKGKGGGPTFWWGDRKATDVWEVARDRSSDRDHPTQKPVEVFAIPLRNSCPPAGLVLDPFAGSGTALIAAEETGRTGYAMEIDPAYCDVIVKRWEDFTGKKAERVR